MFTYNSARKLPTKTSYRRIGGMQRSLILLPPYGNLIDTMKAKIALDDVIVEDSKIPLDFKVSLHKMGSQNNTCIYHIKASNSLVVNLRPF